ncbi:MAG: response regulator [Verrucomicrobiaceae bacterium]|nr:response regulator [Verrucomicrobiaceae bacterium]
MINQESGNREKISESLQEGAGIAVPRLLIVEWDGRQRNYLSNIAGELGYDASVCSTPAEAKKLIDATSFTGVVFDSQLYQESSEEFVSWLVSLGGKKPYVIVVVDPKSCANLNEFLAGGVDDVLLKPLDPVLVRVRLEVMEFRVGEQAKRTREMAGIRRAQGRYENLFLESPDAILVLKNRKGKVIGVNRAVKSVLGYDGKSLLGKYMSLVFPDIFGRDGDATRGDVLSGATVLQAVAYRRPDGGSSYLDIMMSTIPWDRGYAVMMVCRDVGNREGLEGRRIQSSKDRALECFASGVSGEFGDLLTSLGGNLSLLESAPFLNEEARETIARAQDACERGRELTLEIAALAGGLSAPKSQEIDLAPILEKAVQFSLFDFEGVRPLFRLQDLPRVLGNEDELRSMIGAVAKNAGDVMAKAGSESGQLKVEASEIRIGSESGLPLAAGLYVKLEFKDNGPGLAEVDLLRVFDPYFSGNEAGRGIGLSKAAAIVRAHSGHIEVRSELGEGACFDIYLPATDDVAQSPVVTPAGVKPMRVLVLDDEPHICAVLEKALTRAGHDVFCAATGELALRAFEKAEDFGRPFDVLLFDLDIRGGMGGNETLARIRADHPEVRAIVTTGYVNDSVLMNYLDHGFCGVLTKPFRIDHLVATVERLGGGNRG